MAFWHGRPTGLDRDQAGRHSGWDSLGHVNLASCLEKVFASVLDVDDMMEMENVRQV